MAYPNTSDKKTTAKDVFITGLWTDAQCQTVYSALLDIFPKAAALLYGTDPTDLQAAVSAFPENLASYCRTLFPNGVPVTTLKGLSRTMVKFVYTLASSLRYANTGKDLQSALYDALHQGLGSVDYDLATLLSYTGLSADPSGVEPLLTAVGFPVHDGKVTMVGNPVTFAPLVRNVWNDYLSSPADGEAKLRSTAADYIPKATPAETVPAEAVPVEAPSVTSPTATPLPVAAPAPAPQPAQKAPSTDKLTKVYMGSKPLDVNVKRALMHILGDLTKDVELCEQLWAAVQEAHQAAGITPEAFEKNLEAKQDKDDPPPRNQPRPETIVTFSIEKHRDPYRQLDIPTWFKYLIYGGSRIASKTGTAITPVDDQDKFYAFFNIPYSYQETLDTPDGKHLCRRLKCDYTGHLIAAAKARNVTSHTSPDAVDQTTLNNLRYYLKGWVNSITPLCDGPSWQYQTEMALCRETLLTQFYRALDAVSYRVDTILDLLNIPSSDQAKVEQLLHEAGLDVSAGYVDVMGDVELFAEALRAAWNLCQTDWEAGALSLHKQVLQTRQQIESQKLNMEALRMDMLLELTKSDDPQTRLEAMLEIGKRNWNGRPRNAGEAERWFKAAVCDCPSDPEANYWAACIYLDRDCPADSYGITGDVAEAITHLRNAANAGHAPAQALLGQCCETGRGVSQDTNAAAELYRQAADQHNADGLYHLARCTRTSETEAFYLYKEAAMQNHPDAQCALARYYWWGHVVQFDYDRAVQIYENLVKQSHVQAMVELANLYSMDRSVGHNLYRAQPKRAKALYERAAHLGSTDAMVKLGSDHWNSDSIRWLVRAAKVGDKKGQYLLAQRYSQGKGTEKNPLEAFRWYLEAAQQGGESLAIIEVIGMLRQRHRNP